MSRSEPDLSTGGDLDAASDEKHLALVAPRTFKEPAALKWLTSSLDAAQEALGELREDTGRDVSQGARELHKDLRAFINSARRDTGKLAKALQRDFEQAHAQLAQGTAAGESGAKAAATRSRKPRAAAKRSTPKAS